MEAKRLFKFSHWGNNYLKSRYIHSLNEYFCHILSIPKADIVPTDLTLVGDDRHTNHNYRSIIEARLDWLGKAYLKKDLGSGQYSSVGWNITPYTQVLSSVPSLGTYGRQLTNVFHIDVSVSPPPHNPTSF